MPFLPYARLGAKWRRSRGQSFRNGGRRKGFRRQFGLDRSGRRLGRPGPGSRCAPGRSPTRSATCGSRALPVFLYLAFSSGDGRDAAAAAIFWLIAVGDYVDGFLARATGQYSRMGAMLDPVVDRLTILSGAAVCWHFELLPRWALAVLAGARGGHAALAQIALRRAGELQINWLGRIAMWPTMASIFFAMVSESWVWSAMLIVGVALGCSARSPTSGPGSGSLQLRSQNTQVAVEAALRTYNRSPRQMGRGDARPRKVEDSVEEETFPDIGSMSDEELKELIDNLTAEEQEVSYRRRILHGQIDILRAELVNRLRENRPEGEHADQGRRRAAPERDPRRPLGAPDQATDLDRGVDRGDPLPRVRFRQRRGGQLLPEVRRLPLPPRGEGRADDDDLHGRRVGRDAPGRHRRGRRAGTAPPW